MQLEDCETQLFEFEWIFSCACLLTKYKKVGVEIWAQLLACRRDSD